MLVLPYDWRLNIRESVDMLAKTVEATFGSAARMHVVGHSIGGLVTRSASSTQCSKGQRHKEIRRWE